MALTSRDQFEKFVPVNSSFTDGPTIDSFIDQAEEKYLVPLLGFDFYEYLGTIESPSADQLKLFNPIYRAVSMIAAWLYMPFGNVQISESGIQIVSTNDRKAAFEWQVNKVEAAAANMGMDALETVLNYLEAHADDWETYRDGDARKANTAYFINTATQFDDCYTINRSRLTFLCLWPLITQAEEELIVPLITPVVAATYKTKIKAGTLTPDDKVAVKCIQKAIAYQTILDALPTLSVDISPMGLAVNFLSKTLTIKASEGAPDNRIVSLTSHVKEKVNGYLAQIPTLLPGYVPPVTGEIYNVNPAGLSFFPTF